MDALPTKILLATDGSEDAYLAALGEPAADRDQNGRRRSGGCHPGGGPGGRRYDPHRGRFEGLGNDPAREVGKRLHQGPKSGYGASFGLSALVRCVPILVCSPKEEIE